MSSESSGGTLQEKGMEASIPLGTYLRGYRANLRVRTLAIGIACVLGGGILTAETAGPATAASPIPARCTEPAPSPQETCQPVQDKQPNHENAVVAALLGVCIVGGGSMLCAIAGSPESTVPPPPEAENPGTGQ